MTMEHEQVPSTVSPSKVFGELAGLGAALGLFHAIAETTLLTLCGLRFSGLDLAIFAVLSTATATAFASFAAVVMLSLRARMGGWGTNPPVFRQIAWTLLILGYFLVFIKIVAYWDSWRAALTWWSLLAAPALILAWLAVFRKGGRVLLSIWAAACVCTALCGLQLIHALQGGIPAEEYSSLIVRLLLPAAICYTVLAVLMVMTSSSQPFQPIRRGIPVLVLAAVAWSGAWAVADSDVSPRSPADVRAAANTSTPNVVLIVFDTVRADHLDLFGYPRPTMPKLRRFAQDECQYAAPMFATSCWTLPSHASMFTGLYPSAHGAHYPFVSDDPAKAYIYSLRKDVPTLAEFLSGLGYRTAGICANYGMLSGFGLQRGFDYYDATPGSAFLAPRLAWPYLLRLGQWPSAGELLHDTRWTALQRRSVLFSQRQPPYRRAGEITAGARRWLEQDGNRPFFLFLNFLDAHDPYLPPPEDDEKFAKRPPADDWYAFPAARFAAAAPGDATFTSEEIEFMKSQYDASLVSLDREFGRLMDFLKASGRFDNTLIFVTSDHGESFFDQGFFEHGNTLYQPEIGSFVLIKLPRSATAVKPSPLMQFVDFFPSVAAVLNEPPPPGMQGSAWGLGREYALSETFCQLCPQGVLRRHLNWPKRFRREMLSVVIGGQKLIRFSNAPDEVYDLETDPKEQAPRTTADEDFVKQAEMAISERNERLVRPEGLSSNESDRSTIERLRSLGYVK